MKPADKSDRDAAAMAPEAWVRVRALVDDALALPHETRGAFLDASCGDDVALRALVERLAISCERASGEWGFLDQPAGELVAPLLVALANPEKRAANTDLLARLSIALADRYRIEREIGAGGMATVFAAHDVRHARQVAIKVLHPELSAALGTERFLTEIRTTAALQHPHILPLFDSGTADGLLFYVMPLVGGETLRSRLTHEKQLPVADAVRIATEVAGALDYAHRRGVVHRDIKPENILLYEGRPVVSDFGIALAVQSAGGERITRPGLSLGTPQYMSPEQTTGDQEITPRSDVYSLGAVTYEMLTGEPPFTGATLQQIVARVRTEEPRTITTQRKHVTPNVEAAVLTALEKLPADRFDSAGEFARALSDSAFHGTAPIRDGDPDGRVARRRRRALFTSAGVVALALLSVAAWRSRTSDESGEVVRFTLVLPRDVSIVTTAATGNMTVSPDGKVVVFTGSAADGMRRLYARSLEEDVPRLLAGTEGASEPFFSPDGRWIGFWSGNRLQKVSAEGGLPQTITAMAGSNGATWTSKDVIVFASGTSLYSVPSAGGQPTVLPQDSTTGELARMYPIAMTDGDHVLYSSISRNGVSIGLASLSARSGKSVGINGTNPLGVIDGRVIYATRDNALMAVPFDASTGRTTGTAMRVATDVSVGVVGSAKAALSLSGTLAYRASGRGSRMILTNGKDAAQAVLPETRAYAYPRFSPDGRRIAVSIDAGTRSDVWIYNLGSRTSARVSSGGSVNDRPEWTPDGRRILYRTNEGASTAIWWRAANLSEPAISLLAGGPFNFFEAVVTPDGRALVYQLDNDVGIRALTGDTTRTVIASSKYFENQARVSPDGRWVAFVTDESGSDQVVVQALRGPGTRVQVSSNGGIEPVWSRDGMRLFYRANKKFMAATLKTTPRFTVTSRDVLFDDIFVTAAAPHANYDVSPDGKRFLVLEPVADAPILVVHNWATEVRKRTP